MTAVSAGKKYTLLLKTRKDGGETQSCVAVLALFMVLAGCLMLYASSALAGTNPCSVSVQGSGGGNVVSPLLLGGAQNPVCNILENIQQSMRGEAGFIISSIAVVAIGLLALFGKITWTQAMVVALGVGLLFGSAAFIQEFGAETAVADFHLDPVSEVLNAILIAMGGEGGRAVAMVAIAILGLGALYGKINWIQALTLVAGIGMVFGCESIVSQLWNVDAFVGTSAITTGGLTILDPVAGPFYNIVLEMTGDTGVAIASIGVMFAGFMAMLGRLSWPRALMLAAGIALLFGAADVVTILSEPLAPCSLTSLDPFSQVICAFMKELQGPMGKTIGTLAIMIVGILALLGKVSWELGLVVAVGIALVYGANQIIWLMEATNVTNSISSVTCATAAPTPPETGNAIGDILCYIVLILYGPAGKALATVAIIMMGFGALMGKISYSQAFIVAVGIAVTFGAPTIVTLLLPSASTGGCSITGWSLSTIPALITSTLLGC